jgi:hypothetical protein
MIFPRVRPRSGRLPLPLTDFCPRQATTGMGKRRQWRSDHRQECDGSGAAIRVGSQGRATDAVEAEVGRFEPCDCLCDENDAVKAVRSLWSATAPSFFRLGHPSPWFPKSPKTPTRKRAGRKGGFRGEFRPALRTCDAFRLFQAILSFLRNC